MPPFFYSDSTIAGHGSPLGRVPAWPGGNYIDQDTGDRYTKETGLGTTDGWTPDAPDGGPVESRLFTVLDGGDGTPKFFLEFAGGSLRFLNAGGDVRLTYDGAAWTFTGNVT